MSSQWNVKPELGCLGADQHKGASDGLTELYGACEGAYIEVCDGGVGRDQCLTCKLPRLFEEQEDVSSGATNTMMRLSLEYS